jgi:sterol desaturase/sphingolipid hydroxylase (fatty acid hydroxylase superfamily)
MHNGMEGLLELYRSAFGGSAMTAMAVSAGGVLLAAAMRRPGALGPLAAANSAVSIGFWLSNLLFVPATALLLLSVASLLQVAAWPHLAAEQLAALPFLAQLLLFLALDDLSEYWVHRWLHTPVGWPIHAIHHSDSSVNGFTTFRVHLFEPLSVKLVSILTMGWVGFGSEVMAAGVLIGLIHNCYVHFDLDWDHGPLNWLIASPRFHRLHHLDVPAVHNRNLANKFPVWDLLFGTWAGTGRVEGRFGAAMAGVPDTDFVRLWLWPFREWTRMLLRRARMRQA